jgi:hypothetical protein
MPTQTKALLIVVAFAVLVAVLATVLAGLK